MDLIYYSSGEDLRNRQWLFSEVRDTLPDLAIAEFTDCKTLESRLRVPPRDFLAAILELHDHGTLLDIATIQELFADRRVIVSVPNFSYQPLVYAQRLNPLLLVSTGEGYGGIMSALRKWHAMERTASGLV